MAEGKRGTMQSVVSPTTGLTLEVSIKAETAVFCGFASCHRVIRVKAAVEVNDGKDAR